VRKTIDCRIAAFCIQNGLRFCTGIGTSIRLNRC
jgi:hypothetical protein